MKRINFAQHHVSALSQADTEEAELARERSELESMLQSRTDSAVPFKGGHLIRACNIGRQVQERARNCEI